MGLNLLSLGALSLHYLEGYRRQELLPWHSLSPTPEQLSLGGPFMDASW